MSEFNPTQLIGNDEIKSIDPMKQLLPFSPNEIVNKSQNILQSTQSNVANFLSQTADRAFQTKQKIAPFKKLLTFELYDKDGKLAIPPKDSGYKDGYKFSMKINPSSLNITYPPKTVNAVRTMGGWVLQHWYPELGSLTANGIIGNLLQRWSEDTRTSPRWEDFKKLIAIYQNNSIAFQYGTQTRDETKFNPTVECKYDGIVYEGYFESFNFSEDQDNPYTRNYDFSFKFVSMRDLTNISEITKLSGQASEFSNIATKVVSSSSNFISSFQ